MKAIKNLIMALLNCVMTILLVIFASDSAIGILFILLNLWSASSNFMYFLNDNHKRKRKVKK